MGFRLGPQTGAGDGNKEFKAQTRHRGTGSNWKAEEKQDRKDVRKEKRQDKRDAKLLEKKKGGFWS